MQLTKVENEAQKLGNSPKIPQQQVTEPELKIISVQSLTFHSNMWKFDRFPLWQIPWTEMETSQKAFEVNRTQIYKYILKGNINWSWILAISGSLHEVLKVIKC